MQTRYGQGKRNILKNRSFCFLHNIYNFGKFFLRTSLNTSGPSKCKIQGTCITSPSPRLTHFPVISMEHIFSTAALRKKNVVFAKRPVFFLVTNYHVV